jgi:FdhD protein
MNSDNETTLYKEVEVTRIENNVSQITREKLINDCFLEVSLNGKFIEKIMCVNDCIEELAIGNYFHCIDISPESLLAGIKIAGLKTDLHLDGLSGARCIYRRNCGCMINEEVIRTIETEKVPFDHSLIPRIFSDFQNASRLFKETAGVHGAGLYDSSGNRMFFALDIARHNCITKTTGFILKNKLYRQKSMPILMLSSRVNAELIKMCVRSGIRVILARGAASYSAYTQALHDKITLISFIRENRFTIIAQ